jgi:sugar/nucleoside kinase (ribokinase family)
MKRVLTIGEILVEIMAVEPGDGFRSPIALTGPYPSGAPAIFIDQVGKLGQPAAMISAVGNDDFGRINLDRLSADGVDVSAVRIETDYPTGSAFVRYRHDGERDFVFNIKHSANGSIRPSPETDRQIETADHLHVMGTALASPVMASLILDALVKIKARGGTVSFDPNIRKEVLSQPGIMAALEQVFAHTDIFLPSGSELFLFTTETEPSRAIADLLARGIKVVVVKHGADGASYHDHAGSITVDGFAVTEIDPTGAGDSFGATFVTYWLRGCDPQFALIRANAAGALAVSARGPMEGNANAAVLEAFIAGRSDANGVSS